MATLRGRLYVCGGFDGVERPVRSRCTRLACCARPFCFEFDANTLAWPVSAPWSASIPQSGAGPAGWPSGTWVLMGQKYVETRQIRSHGHSRSL